MMNSVQFNPANPAAGLYQDVPLATYLSCPLPSQSTLKEMRASPAHFKCALDGESATPPTDAMLLGSALHVAFFEPEQMPAHVVRWDGAARRGKDWEAFKEEHAGKIILTEGMHEKLVGMARALRRHPEVRRWAGKLDGTEIACVGDLYGVRMKGRCDGMSADTLIDLKKVACADPRSFSGSAHEFGYHIQAHIYRRLFGRDRFLFIAVEDTPPHDVVVFEPTAEMLREGERQTGDLIARFKFCERHGEWPGRSLDVLPLDLPAWAQTAEDIVLDGEPAFSEEA